MSLYRKCTRALTFENVCDALQAQYNMAWLTTYTEQLTRIAKVEHWDVFQGRVENIAHRVRDLYASEIFAAALGQGITSLL